MKRTPLKRAPLKRTGLKKKSYLKRSSIKVGKKAIEWYTLSKQIRAELSEKGINSCEARLDGCLGNWPLGLAHTKKRRHLSKDELGMVALLCQYCHDTLEHGDQKVMFSTITDIINARRKKTTMLKLPTITTISGPTGAGKTAFALRYATMSNDGATLYVNTEMTEAAVLDRLSVMATDTPSSKRGSGTSYENIIQSKTGHIKLFNGRVAPVSIDILESEIKDLAASGTEVLVIIDSFSAWIDSIKLPVEDVIHKILELQETTGANFLLVCQDNRSENQAVNFGSDRVISMSMERGGKMVNGIYTVRFKDIKNRYGPSGIYILQFHGDTQRFDGLEKLNSSSR